MSIGKLLHAPGAATLNARSLNLSLVRGTNKWFITCRSQNSVRRETFLFSDSDVVIQLQILALSPHVSVCVCVSFTVLHITRHSYGCEAP